MQVTFEEAKEKATSLGAIYIETSAKQGLAVEDTFKRLCEKILDRLDSGEIQILEETEGIKLGRKPRSGSVYSKKDVNVNRKNSCCF